MAFIFLARTLHKLCDFPSLTLFGTGVRFNFQVVLAMMTLALTTGASAATPSDLASSRYSVYSAAKNADACPDYLVRAPDIPIIVNTDDMSMIMVPPSTTPFMLISTNADICSINSSSCANLEQCNYRLVSNLTRDQYTGAEWIKTSSSVLPGDVVGDGGGSLLIVPDSSASLVFNVRRDPATRAYSLLQAFTASDYQIGAAGTTISLRDVDGNGRSDIVITKGTDTIATYSANTQGLFSPDADDNRMAAAIFTWNRFVDRLRNGTVDDVLALVSGQTQGIFRNALTAPGANLQEFASSIKRFSVIDVNEVAVRGAIVIPVNGTDTIYYVVIGQEVSDGTWKIYSM